MGKNYHFMHPLGPTWNKEMFDDGKKLCNLVTHWVLTTNNNFFGDREKSVH